MWRFNLLESHRLTVSCWKFWLWLFKLNDFLQFSQFLKRSTRTQGQIQGCFSVWNSWAESESLRIPFGVARRKEGRKVAISFNIKAKKHLCLFFLSIAVDCQFHRPNTSTLPNTVLLYIKWFWMQFSNNVNTVSLLSHLIHLTSLLDKTFSFFKKTFEW